MNAMSPVCNHKHRSCMYTRNMFTAFISTFICICQIESFFGTAFQVKERIIKISIKQVMGNCVDMLLNLLTCTRKFRTNDLLRSSEQSGRVRAENDIVRICIVLLVVFVPIICFHSSVTKVRREYFAIRRRSVQICSIQ